jgi:hypothetical protein
LPQLLTEAAELVEIVFMELRGTEEMPATPLQPQEQAQSDMALEAVAAALVAQHLATVETAPPA